MVEIELPLFIELGIKKPKKYYLNMNGYRNWHHHLNNDIKTKFSKSISIPTGMRFKKITVEYILYFKTRTKRDGMNVASVLSKFFLDSLVQQGVISDDDYTVVISETWKYGGMADRDYCKAVIHEVD